MTGARIQFDRLEQRLARILRGGVAVSVTLLVCGLVLHVAPAPRQASLTLLHAGLVVLIATPILRVASSFVSFVHAGDRLFAGLTAAVLAILGMTITLALARP
jgi:uncharacterized membrane protein